MADFGVVHLDDLEEITDGRQPLRPVRLHFGITTFGATAWTGKAVGDQIINDHAEDDDDSSEELYVVMSGRATFVLDGAEHDAPAGTFVHVRPRVRRSAVAVQAGTTVLAIGAGQEGKPYDAHDWEAWVPLYGLYDQGRYDEMADQARPLLEPEHGMERLYYNVACAESLGGRPDDALAHLRTAIDLLPSLAQSARTDSDFDAIRERPEFTAMLQRAGAL